MENLELKLPAFKTASPADLYELSMLQEMDDDEYLLDVLNILVTETGNEFNKMSDAVKTGDIDTVCKQAHKIKGSAGIIQAESLIALLTAIEALGKKGTINNELAELVDNAGYHYAGIEKALKIEISQLQK